MLLSESTRLMQIHNSKQFLQCVAQGLSSEITCQSNGQLDNFAVSISLDLLLIKCVSFYFLLCTDILAITAHLDYSFLPLCSKNICNYYCITLNVIYITSFVLQQLSLKRLLVSGGFLYDCLTCSHKISHKWILCLLYNHMYADRVDKVLQLQPMFYVLFLLLLAIG